MSSSELQQGDLGLILQIIEDGHHDDPGDALPWAVLDGLCRLVPCDIEVTMNEFDPWAGRDILSQGIEAGVRFFERPTSDASDPFWALFWGSAFCSYPQRSGDLVSVIRDDDVLPTRADRRPDRLLTGLMESNGVVHTLMLSLPSAPGGQVRRLLFRRGKGPGFTERDRQVLTLLRPHLYEIWLGAERRRSGVPRLTPREWEVLRLSAAGRSNAEIAALMVVSVGTVRKHMEHVMERLGVHSRAAAAALALPHHPQLSVAPSLRHDRTGAAAG